MACFGVQAKQMLTLDALAPLRVFFSHTDGPLYWDPAISQDTAGFYNLVAIAYWADVESYQRWQQQSGFAAWWRDPQREDDNTGWLLEVVSPDSNRFETIFSALDQTEGIAHLAISMGDTILEHGYWGSARDRLPIAQQDPLLGCESRAAIEEGDTKRRQVSGTENLCLIRSGQDWTATLGQEREMYIDGVEPVLKAGMNFLRDQGNEVGCLSCRFMRLLDPQTGEMQEKTYGLAHFSSLANLEQWAKSHPTHVAIFGGFMRYVQALNFKVQLRLYHEIAVIPAQAQFFEYINCHQHTGLLNQYTWKG